MYDTELMLEILTSRTARAILDELSPIYGEGRVALWLFQIIGAELDETRTWTAETMDQVVPHTATWSLDYWEDELALPRNSELTTQQRRARILSYLRTRAPMNPYTLAGVASGAAGGVPCTVEERTGAPSAFTLHVNGFPTKGMSTAIRRAVDQAKQARLSYQVLFEENTISQVFSAGITRRGLREITMGITTPKQGVSPVFAGSRTVLGRMEIHEIRTPKQAVTPIFAGAETRRGDTCISIIHI